MANDVVLTNIANQLKQIVDQLVQTNKVLTVIAANQKHSGAVTVNAPPRQKS